MAATRPFSRRPWPSVPRETRDTWFMLALIAWTIAPHLLRLAPWLTVLSGAVLLWRAWLAWRQAPLPGRASVLAVVLLAAGLTWWQQRTLLGKEAGVTLLVLLMALKTLELRARRDALVVFFLGFFLVLTHFLYSQSLLTALAMGVSVWGWLTALTLAHMPAGFPRLRDAGRLAAKAALVGTPVMVALFLLFPRIAPLWGLPSETPRTGLSDTLHIGDMAELAQDDSIALRLRVEGPALPPQALYFRGPVLSQYDGRRWRTAAEKPAPTDTTLPPLVALPGPSVRYEMTLEPMRIAWLPLLELTPVRPTSTPALPELQAGAAEPGDWPLLRPLAERLRLQAEAWPQAQRGLFLSQDEQRSLTALPPGRHPRTKAWARDLRQQPELREAKATALADAVMQHIRTAGFSYTLAPGSYTGDTIDEFWLDRRLGFCEHFAASFVVVMRAMGVPARIVAGYQGGDPGLVDGYLIVRQSHAHAWAEFWQPDRGWVRADPTAAVAPDRIDRGSALQPAPGVVAEAFDAMNPTLRLRLRQFVETLDNRWNQWVLGYGQQQQLKLLKELGLPSADAGSVAQVLGGLVAAAALAGALWAAWDARRRTPWQRLHQRLAAELARLDVEAPPHLGLEDLAQRVLKARGSAAQGVAEALRELQRLRYGPATVALPRQQRAAWNAWWQDFRRRCAALRSAATAPR